MNIQSDLFLVLRYLIPKRNAVSLITCISVLGVTLGVGILIIVIAVMTGFTNLMEEKLLETTAHFQIQTYGGYISNPQKMIAELAKDGYKTAPVVLSPTLIQNKQNFIPKLVIGVDPFIETPMNLDKKIVKGIFSLNPGELLISKVMADELDIKVGDKMLLHSSRKLTKMIKIKAGGGVELSKNKRVYLPDEFIVTGLFSFGKYDFDKEFIFMGIDDADELFEIPFGAATHIYGWVDNPSNMYDTINKLRDRYFGYKVSSWKEMNAYLLNDLEAQKSMMFFLFIFIVLVAAFSITNTLITVVIQKTREIGLLKALGASSFRVMRIFVLQGAVIGITGTACGIGFGITLLHFRNDILSAVSAISGRNMFPPEFYFFDKLPADIIPMDIGIVAITTIILCTIGGVIPAWRAAYLDPAKALRDE